MPAVLARRQVPAQVPSKASGGPVSAAIVGSALGGLLFIVTALLWCVQLKLRDVRAHATAQLRAAEELKRLVEAAERLSELISPTRGYAELTPNRRQPPPRSVAYLSLRQTAATARSTSPSVLPLLILRGDSRGHRDGTINVKTLASPFAPFPATPLSLPMKSWCLSKRGKRTTWRPYRSTRPGLRSMSGLRTLTS